MWIGLNRLPVAEIDNDQQRHNRRADRNTCVRGGRSVFAAFAAAKFGLRGLAQSLARELQPQGIHVAHVVLDGFLLGSPSVQRFGGPAPRTIDPAEVARAYRWLAEQNRSAWTHELVLRPNSERF